MAPPRAGRPARRNPGARPAAGDPQRRRRRGHRAGPRRPAPVRQRRGARAARLRVVRGAAVGARRLDRATASRSSTRRGEPMPTEALPGRRALAGERRRRGGRALPPARHRRGALVGGQGDPDPRRGRLRDDGDQRDRGHHDPQARGARAALPGRQQRPARRARSSPADVLGQVAAARGPRGGRLGGRPHARRLRASSWSRSRTATPSA